MSDARWGDPREYGERDRDEGRPRVYHERDRRDHDPRDGLVSAVLRQDDSAIVVAEVNGLDQMEEW